ncbi:MAG: hypothetical protein HUU20_04670 [Pirellulales bacterium]|nr:hypothetical protein [Pirellulales bacterium]
MTKTATIHAMQKWEYEFLTKKTEAYLVKELNELGQHGWELVAAGQCKERGGDTAWTAFLKRPYVPHAAKPAAEKVGEKTTESPAPSAPSDSTSRGFDLEGDEFSIKEE